MKCFLTISLLALAFPTDVNAGFWSTFKFKTNDGGNIVVKKENVSCKGPFDLREEWDRNGWNRRKYGWTENFFYECKAYGVQTNLVGSRYVKNDTARCYGKGKGDGYVCGAAQKFKIYPYWKLKDWELVNHNDPKNVNRWSRE